MLAKFSVCLTSPNPIFATPAARSNRLFIAQFAIDPFFSPAMTSGFVSTKELNEEKAARQEEWEKVRKPTDAVCMFKLSKTETKL